MNFSRSQILPTTLMLYLLFPRKSYRLPALRESCLLAGVVCEASAILVAKIHNYLESGSLFSKKCVNGGEDLTVFQENAGVMAGVCSYIGKKCLKGDRVTKPPVAKGLHPFSWVTRVTEG